MYYRKFNKNLKKEFNDTFKDEIEIIEPKVKEKRKLELKPIFAFMVAVMFGLLVFQHIGIQIYNSNIEKQNEQLLNRTDKGMTKIDGSKNISSQLNYISKEEKSVLTKLFSMQLIGCATKDQMWPTDEGIREENSINTNVQEQGIDESDTVKSDGAYIYSLMNNGCLYVYDLTGRIVDKKVTSAFELYIYEDKIICLCKTKYEVYSFDGRISLNLKVEHLSVLKI